ncbi:MAG: ABC transporter permease [Clostridiaceae bacterium]|nr:ABC transporter permease [Clostridiaceae bacterium]
MKRRGRISKIIYRAYVALIMLFLYSPIAVLILFSFNAGESRGKFAGFSLRWYKDLMQRDALLGSFRNTLIVAAIASVVATLIGTYAAIVIHKMPSIMRNTTIKVANIPMLNAEIVTGIAFMLFFGAISVPLGFSTILIAHITFNVPYVILSVLPKLRQLNKSTYEAALDLGATPAMAFRKIILPDILPGIISGLLIAFTLSLDDFIISYFTAGAAFKTLSVEINTLTKRRIPLSVNALSTIIMIVVFVILVINNLRKRPNGNKALIKERSA